MEIIVKNNDAIKAYKVLCKKLNKDGLFRELKRRRHFISKGDSKKEKSKVARVRARKDQIKRDIIREKEEKWLVIESKKRARQLKKTKRSPNKS